MRQRRGREVCPAVQAFAGGLIVMASSALLMAGQRTIVDSLGRRVPVPARVERLISLEPEVTRIIVALGAGEKLVGIDYFLRHHDHLFKLIHPASSELPVVSNQGQDLNYEQALRLRPDIIIASPSEFRMAETVERKTGLPAAALASMGRIDRLIEEIETLGTILGREARAAELVAFIKARLAALRRQVPTSEGNLRPTVYLSFWGALERTPVAYEPVDVAGGRNLASGLLPSHLGTTATTVSIEQILRWDPEIILIQGSFLPEERRVTVEGVLSDGRLASVRAVRDGRVHYTFGFWYWWDPALVLVETSRLARLFFPGSGPAPDLLTEGEETFRFFYGREGLFRALCGVLRCHEWDAR